LTIIIYSLANDNLRKRKTPDEKMHILLLYILKYAGVDLSDAKMKEPQMPDSNSY